MDTRRILAIDANDHDVTSAFVSLGLPGLPQVRERKRIPVDRHGGERALVEAVVATVAERLSQNAGPVDAIGLALAGVVDPIRGTFDVEGELVEVGQMLFETTDATVRILSDVQAEALAEALWGPGRLWQSSLVVDVAKEVVGTYVNRRTIPLGAHGLALSIGHVASEEAAGRLCSCGATGHMETVAAGPGILKDYIRMAARDTTDDGIAVDLPLVFQLAEAGDDSAIWAVARAGRALGGVLGSLCNVIDPAGVILTGTVTKAGRVWDEALRESFQTTVMKSLTDTPIEHGEIGPNVRLVGAAEHADTPAFRELR